MRNVAAFREFNLLRVQVPPDPNLRKQIAQHFTVRRVVTTREKGKIVREEVPEPCFEVVGAAGDPLQHYRIGSGFTEKLRKLLLDNKYRLVVRENRPLNAQQLSRLIPNHEVIDDISFRDHQRGIIESMMRNFRGQYIAATGCHAAGHLLRMHDGSTKPVQDITEGNLLRGPDGASRRVLHLCRGRDTMYRVTPEKGKPFVVNGDHILHLHQVGAPSVNRSVREYLVDDPTVKAAYRLCYQRAEGDELVAFEVEQLGVDDFYGFILNRDHLYVDSDGLVHHNSGKSFVVKSLFKVFRGARILVTTYSSNVLSQMWESVTADGSVDAGIYSSKKKSPGGRGMFVSLDSLHRFSGEEWDIMLLDEKHEACTIKRLQKLMAVKARRAYALSAEESDRADNADMWTEAIFGPVRRRHHHVSAVSQGDVVPVKVYWKPVRIRDFPALQAGSPAFERKAVWRNMTRNQVVVDAANEAREKFGQTLVYVKTVEHGIVLSEALGCPLACGTVTPERLREFKSSRLVPDDYVPPSPAQVSALQRKFAKGEVDLVVCTSVWKRGVDFPGLRAVVRADGSASVEDSVQVTGRVTRTKEGKEYGVVFDFVDDFHDALRYRAVKRRATYKREGYEQINLQS